MKFLGLRLCDHDSNVTYTDGTSVKYIKFERWHQVKHFGFGNFYSWLPELKHWNIDLSNLDAAAICIDAYRGHNLVVKDDLLFQERPKNTNILEFLRCPVYIVDHHYAHALSCWPLVNTSTIKTHFVFDGFGDLDKTFTVFSDNKYVTYGKRPEQESFGILLAMLGRKLCIDGHFSDVCGKVMGLKSYGNTDFNFIKEYEHLTLREIDKVFDIKAWLPYMCMDAFQNDRNRLASIHTWVEKKFEEFFLQYAKPEDRITFSGGVAQNTVINGKLKKLFPNLFIPPHSPDEGLSLGCVEFLRQKYEQPYFDTSGFPFWQDDQVPSSKASTSTINKVADLLAQNKIVGWYQGQGEVGPRALGHRSILMNAALPEGKDTINKKVKNREPYRPFGCSVLEENVSEYFDCNYSTPYMLHVVDVIKKDIPSVTHVDGTCRIQTVNSSNEEYYTLLNKFKDLTGIPLVLNTSLNIQGRPIAGSTKDAVELFKNTAMDAMCIGDELLIK